jgi:hypothetical protein
MLFPKIIDFVSKSDIKPVRKKLSFRHAILNEKSEKGGR